MKTIKRKSEMPTRKITTALLGGDVGLNWENHFPNFRMANVSARDMQADALRLKALLKGSNDNVSDLRQNTADLAAQNKLINSALNTLKSHIKIECWQNGNNLEAEYSKHGLYGTGHKLPSDNGLRQVALQALVSKLQEPNNPIATQAQGLAFWLDLQTRHATLWNNSNQYRATKSVLAQHTDVLVAKITLDLKRVRKGLEIEYAGTDLARQKRAMGFLKESL